MSKQAEAIKVDPKTLPASCPPRDDEARDMHPRVYLEFSQGEAICPYCNAHYALAE